MYIIIRNALAPIKIHTKSNALFLFKYKYIN